LNHSIDYDQLSIYPNMGAMHSDIITHLITLIPLDDHNSVSAMSCTCRAGARLFARWLRTNDIVDVRGLAPDAEICLCDRMHGTFTRALTLVDRYILTHRLRGYVSSIFSVTSATNPSPCTYQFVYGQLVTWSSWSSSVYEVATVAGERVIIHTTFGDDSRAEVVTVCMQYGAISTIDVFVVRLQGPSMRVVFSTGSRGLYDDKYAAYMRLRAVDWEEVLAPYLARGPPKWS
jgi:hypothetical protein